MASSDHLVLVGGMGSGKTTIGRLLAARLGRPLHDSDLDLGASGRNARAIAQASGVDTLHGWEADHLLKALAEPDPAVIAAAGSVVEDPRSLEALEPPFVVWLRAPIETLVSRMARGNHRRDLGDDPVMTMATLARRRDPAYRQVADLIIDVGRLTPSQAADAILSRYASVARRNDPRSGS